MQRFRHIGKLLARPPHGLKAWAAPAAALLLCLAPARASDVACFFALDADLKAFAAAAKPAGQPVKLGQHTVQRLTVGGHRVYAVKMGSGAVETALSASTLLTRFRCDLAFSVGPVGALDDALAVGSWHEVGPIMRYQRGSWDATGFQLAVPAQSEDGDQQPAGQVALALPGLFAKAGKVCVTSGEVFVASSAYRVQRRAAAGAGAVDMNLFGLEAACRDQGVPLRSWRVVSDRADDDAGAAFRAFVAGYDGAGGKALAELVGGLPADPNSAEIYPELKKLLEKPPAAEPIH